MNRRVIALCVVSPLHIGGAETNMLQIAKHLSDRFRIIFVGPMSEIFQDNAKALGIGLIPLPMASKFSFTMIFRLAYIFYKERVQIVHTHDSRGGLLGRIAAKIAGVKAVHTVHTPAIFQTTKPLKRQIYAFVENILNSRFTHYVIFVSNSVKAVCSEIGIGLETMSVYVPNGIDLNYYDEIRRLSTSSRKEWRDKLGITNEILVSWVGRIAQEKGLNYLINACTKHPKTNSIKYLIIGDGPQRKHIETLIQQYGLEHQFIFTGFRPHDEVCRLLTASDIFVLPSLYECFPYSILEAMAIGLPCVVTNVGDNGELIKDGYNGFVVPVGDTVLLAEAIKKLSDDPDMRKEFGKRSCELAQQYDEIKMVKEVEKIYESLIS